MTRQEHLELIYSAMVNVCERYRRSADKTWEEKGDFFYVYLAEKFPLLPVCDAVDLVLKLRLKSGRSIPAALHIEPI